MKALRCGTGLKIYRENVVNDTIALNRHSNDPTGSPPSKAKGNWHIRLTCTPSKLKKVSP